VVANDGFVDEYSVDVTFGGYGFFTGQRIEHTMGEVTPVTGFCSTSACYFQTTIGDESNSFHITPNGRYHEIGTRKDAGGMRWRWENTIPALPRLK
jgi:hypothetical protein